MRLPPSHGFPSHECQLSNNLVDCVYIYYQELLFIVIKYPWLFSRCIQNLDVGVYRRVMRAGGCPLIIAQ